MFTLRNHNVLTKETTLEEIYNIKNFPIHMGCVELPTKDDKFIDLTFDICKKTGIIQVRQLIDFNYLYITPHNDAFGKIWENLSKEIVRISEKYISNKKKYIEIGGGSGKLALNFINKYKEIENYTIYEPNTLTNFNNYKKINLIKKYFTDDTIIKKNDIYVHSHVMEHVINPVDFIKSITQNIEKGDYMIFAVPNLKQWLMRKYTNCLNFEHTLFIIDDYIDIILENNGFEICEKQKYKEDHSLIYVTKFNGKCKNLSYPNLYNQNKLLINNFINYHKSLVEQFNSQMINYDKPIYLFGGHIFSLYLIKFGLNVDKIKCILDNSPSKNKKRLYGTNLYVESPNIIQKDEECMVILKAAGYQEEIRTQLNNLSKNVIILE